MLEPRLRCGWKDTLILVTTKAIASVFQLVSGPQLLLAEMRNCPEARPAWEHPGSSFPIRERLISAGTHWKAACSWGGMSSGLCTARMANERMESTASEKDAGEAGPGGVMLVFVALPPVQLVGVCQAGGSQVSVPQRAGSSHGVSAAPEDEATSGRSAFYRGRPRFAFMGSSGLPPAPSRLGCGSPCPSLVKGFCLCLMVWLQIYP